MLTEGEFKVNRGLRTNTGDYTIGREKSLLVPILGRENYAPSCENTFTYEQGRPEDFRAPMLVLMLGPRYKLWG